MLTIKINVSKTADQLMAEIKADVAKKIKAISLGLTDTARDARQAVMNELPTVFDRPTPFTMRSIGYTPAMPSALTARVFIRDPQVAYLRMQITGGVELPKRRALLDPVAVQLNQYGNIPRTKIHQLLARKDTFSGTVRGIPGIWQRTGHKGLKLLVAYESTRQVKPRFDFAGIAKKSIERTMIPNLRARLASAR